MITTKLVKAFVLSACVQVSIVIAADPDKHEKCVDWASWGECEKNPGWMLANCATSCNKGSDEVADAMKMALEKLEALKKGQEEILAKLAKLEEAKKAPAIPVLARLMNARQSSTLVLNYRYPAARAIDGQWSNCDHQQSSMTGGNPNEWWSADFEVEMVVNRVVVYHESDCCAGETKGATVVVSDGTTEHVCGTLLTDNTAEPETVQCNGASGQSVKILGDGSRLRLCEVQVYGTKVPANAPAAGGTCTDPDPNMEGDEDYMCPSGYSTKNPAVSDGACSSVTTCNTNCCDQATRKLQLTNAQQSSTFADNFGARAAYMAIDGNVGNDGQPMICDHYEASVTGDNPNEWWSADFKATMVVDRVVVYHEADCCAGQTKGSTVVVSDGTTEHVCGTLLTDKTPTHMPEIVLCSGAIGRSVKILADGSRIRLCEVEVYGREAQACNTFATSSACPSSWCTWTGTTCEAPTESPTPAPVPVPTTRRRTRRRRRRRYRG
jgi:hypothetical protein